MESSLNCRVEETLDPLVLAQSSDRHHVPDHRLPQYRLLEASQPLSLIRFLSLLVAGPPDGEDFTRRVLPVWACREDLLSSLRHKIPWEVRRRIALGSFLCRLLRSSLSGSASFFRGATNKRVIVCPLRGSSRPTLPSLDDRKLGLEPLYTFCLGQPTLLFLD